MPTARVLQSVAHNIAHHAASGLSFLHPHAYRGLHALGLNQLTFDLLQSSPLSLEQIETPLSLSANALQKKFRDILNSAGFQADDLIGAILEMRFPSGDEYICDTACSLTTKDGKSFNANSSSLE